MKNFLSYAFLALFVVSISIVSILNSSCGEGGSGSPPAKTCIWFSGGGFCTPPWENGSPAYDAVITITNTKGEVIASKTQVVKAQRDHLDQFQYANSDGTLIQNTNCIEIDVPASGAFNVEVSFVSKTCLKCCQCFGNGGKATLTGSSMQTSNDGLPIEIILNHDTISGCPIEKCC